MIFDVTDIGGKRVIFTKEKWEQKRVDHPELNKPTFLKRVKRAIIEPDEVWPDYGDGKNKRCYYKKYSTDTYAKVVVWHNSCPFVVITAFEINYIKESKYPDLNRIY